MRRSSLRVVAALLSVLSVPLLQRVAGADPSPQTIAAKKELQRLEVEISSATEDWNASRLRLGEARRVAATAQARVTQKERDVASLREGVGSLMAAAYRSGGGVDPVLRLMTSATPETFLTRAGTVDAIARNQNGRLRTLRAARRDLEQQQVLAREAVAAATAIEASMERTRVRIEGAIARQQELVTRLETADARRERLEREAAERRAAQLAAARARAREAAAAAARARREAAAARASRSRVTAPRPPAYDGPASGRASVAVAEAYRQLGKPYQWGAEGPDRFDCSGLTMWVWAKAGVSLPHSSRMQFDQGRHVAQSELRPGDLVFYGSPIHHVGIYVGDGKYINAPQTGDVVKVASVYRDDYTGAVRL
ncbi:MAG TPA: NlpC/P60 family protein [Frankiaceae bacterium]|nr:NlpC/P60 family protein [Frankiaceae bacterium]